MRRKKKIETRKIVLIALIVICLILGYVANVVSTTRQLTVFEKAIKDSILTVQNIITYPIDFVIDKINVSKEKHQMYIEYEELKSKYEQIQQYILENEELKKQVEDLKNAMGNSRSCLMIPH